MARFWKIIMRIVCLSSTFPTPSRFWRGAFVQNFCLALEAGGATVSAIVPEGWHACIKDRIQKTLLPKTLKQEQIRTTIAAYPSLSVLAARHRILAEIDRILCQRSIERQLDRMDPKPDLIYAHFVRGGLLVLDWCKTNKVRLAVISGESSYQRFLSNEDSQELRTRIEEFDYLFFVSDRNQQELSNFVGAREPLGSVLGNAVSCEDFQPLDKLACRKELGLPQEAII